MPRKTSTRKAVPTTIADSISSLVARGALSPGVHLGQKELAERFGSSRVPVREALKLLAAEGIVIHDQNRGFFIADLSSDEARQLYRMRHILEVELLNSIEWPGESQLAAFRVELDKLESLLKAGKSTEWVDRYRKLHGAIFDLSPNKVIVAETLRLARLTDRYLALAPMHLSLADRSVDPERHLVQALANRDRRRLLRIFDVDRSEIEARVITTLKARQL